MSCLGVVFYGIGKEDVLKGLTPLGSVAASDLVRSSSFSCLLLPSPPWSPLYEC